MFRIPEDLKRFKEKTEGHVVIMGRLTFESIGRPLPKRINIIISRDNNLRISGCRVVNSFEQALEVARKLERFEIFIIGGGQIYREAIRIADKLYLTIIDKELDADTFFPDYADFNKVVYEKSGHWNSYKYKFLDLEK